MIAILSAGPFFFLPSLPVSLVPHHLFIISGSLSPSLCTCGVTLPIFILRLSSSSSNLLFISLSFLFHPSLESPYIARFMFLESASLHQVYANTITEEELTSFSHPCLFLFFPHLKKILFPPQSQPWYCFTFLS